MTTLELYEPRTGQPLGPKVTLVDGILDFAADPEMRIRGILDRAITYGVEPLDIFDQYDGWSNSQGTAGLRRFLGDPEA